MCDRNADGVIEREEFHNHYREISRSIEPDGAFIGALRRAWRVWRTQCLLGWSGQIPAEESAREAKGEAGERRKGVRCTLLCGDERKEK
jgi:hypothetical protein